MTPGLYNIALASITLALVLLWSFQPGWGALELFALFILVSPIYGPFLYKLAVRLWVLRRRRNLNLPDVSDRDLIDFVGEELDRAGIAWQWRVGWRVATRGDEILVGEDDEDEDLSVSVRHGILRVSDGETGTTRFVDPVAAVDYAVNLYEGPKRTDSTVFVDTAEEEI